MHVNEPLVKLLGVAYEAVPKLVVLSTWFGPF
jgi:hypothetical protein